MRLEAKRASVPTLFLELGDAVTELLAHPDVAKRWDEDSSLDGMTIGALAAHLGRAFTTAWFYMQADPCPAEDDIDASAYFHSAFDHPVEEVAELNASILQRSIDDADGGPVVVLDRHRSTIKKLRTSLVGEYADRGIEVFGGLCMPLDSYLVTRMVEAVVHSDDLAHSLGIETPTYAPDVMDLVMVALLGVARHRQGDIAILREFARSERSTGAPMQVF